MNEARNIQEPTKKAWSIGVVVARLLCLTIGHKPAEITDSGYEFCDRCSAHSYYDYPNYYKHSGYLIRPFYWIKWRTVKIVKDLNYWNYKRKGGELPF